MPNSTYAAGTHVLACIWDAKLLVWFIDNVKCDRPRLPIGGLQLTLSSAVLSGEMWQRLYEARVDVTLTTLEGTVNISVLTTATQDLHIVRVTADEQLQYDFTWYPKQGDSSFREACEPYHPNPEVRTVSSGGMIITTQPLLSSNCFSTGLEKHIESDATVWVVSTSQPQECKASQSYVQRQLGMYKQKGHRALQELHEQWWRSYYPASFISISHTKIEAYYWAQIYVLGSATRDNQPPPTYGVFDHTGMCNFLGFSSMSEHLGPWFLPTATCCPLFNWDMNLPVQYWIIPTSNRLELGKPLFKLLNDERNQRYLHLNAGELCEGIMVWYSQKLRPFCRR